MIENATVEDLQHELQVMIEESIADMYGEDDEVDEGTIAVDLYCSMTYMYDYPAELLAEVARREFGYMPTGARPGISAEFPLEQDPEW